MACADHIPGENQSLETFISVQMTRQLVFFNYMTQKYPELTHMDEADWDDQYRAWLEFDQGS